MTTIPSRARQSPVAWIRDMIEARLRDVNVGVICVITAYDDDTQSCSVRPVTLRAHVDERGERTTEQQPIVENVPVVFPGSGGRRIKWPVAEGDYAMVTFSQASTDRWLREGGSDLDPLDDRQHDYTDMIAFPGVQPLSSAGDAGAMIEFTKDDEILAGGTTKLVTLTEFLNHKHDSFSAPPTEIVPSVPPGFDGTAQLRGSASVTTLLVLVLILNEVLQWLF